MVGTISSFYDIQAVMIGVGVTVVSIRVFSLTELTQPLDSVDYLLEKQIEWMWKAN